MKWFLNLRTATKLLSSFVLMALIVCFVGVYGLMKLGQMNATVDKMYNSDLIPVEDLQQAQGAFSTIRIDALKLSMAKSQAEQTALMQTMTADEADVVAKAGQYGQDAQAASEQAFYATFQNQWTTFSGTLGNVVQMIQAGKTSAAQTAMHDQLNPQGDAIDGTFQKLSSLAQGLAHTSVGHARARYGTTRSVTVIVTIVAVLLSIAFGLATSMAIAGPLKRMVALIVKVAAGNLTETSDVETKDEVGQLGQSINRMIHQLRDTIRGIAEASEHTSSASEQISAAMEQISAGSMNQATTSEAMSDLFRELSTAIHDVARSAEEAAELSNQTSALARQGGTVVQSSVHGMTLVSEHMSKLNDDSRKVGDIVEVIDDIAEQTNLLALNAAIEAARAGDQGRGFAVVADEVRKLAERTSEATKQITTIIKTMQENTHQSVKAVEEGVHLTERSGEAFSDIIRMVNETAAKVTDIAAASEQQAAQSSEVQGSIESISATTQEAAASSEETSAAAQSLAQLAQELNGYVTVFRID